MTHTCKKKLKYYLKMVFKFYLKNIAKKYYFAGQKNVFNTFKNVLTT